MKKILGFGITQRAYLHSERRMAKISQFGLYSDFSRSGGAYFLSLDYIVNFFFMSHKFVLHVAQMGRTVLPTLEGSKMCAGLCNCYQITFIKATKRYKRLKTLYLRSQICFQRCVWKIWGHLQKLGYLTEIWLLCQKLGLPSRRKTNCITLIEPQPVLCCWCRIIIHLMYNTLNEKFTTSKQ